MDRWKTKYLNQERYDMVNRQIECDLHNAEEAINLLGFDKAKPYLNKINISLRQQKYALKKGRFR